MNPSSNEALYGLPSKLLNRTVIFFESPMSIFCARIIEASVVDDYLKIKCISVATPGLCVEGLQREIGAHASILSYTGTCLGASYQHWRIYISDQTVAEARKIVSVFTPPSTYLDDFQERPITAGKFVGGTIWSPGPIASELLNYLDNAQFCMDVPSF